MSKFLKIIINTVHFALIYQLVKYLCCETTEEIVEINYVIQTPLSSRKMVHDIKKSKRNSTYLKLKQLQYKRPERLPTDLKYILKYTKAFAHYTSSIFSNGQEAFIANNCSHINCHVTDDREFLGDIKHFDAIVFDVENDWNSYPIFRADHQLYVFTASESAANFPMCDPKLDNYYNLTWTYKLDSDIRWTYLSVLDKKGYTIGPQHNMEWIKDTEPVTTDVKNILNQKTKGVAWFVSHCNSRNDRENVAKRLIDALKPFNITVDIFGPCGHLTCPRDRVEECLKALRNDYHFYLAFENSMSEDYVTEKILYPLQYDTVPVVFGGADYSRFLPPNSYLNAGTQSASHIASEINRAITNRSVYYDYFRWRNYYEYSSSPQVADVCRFCEQLNKEGRHTIQDFRSWWNPKFKSVCRESELRVEDVEKF